MKLNYLKLSFINYFLLVFLELLFKFFSMNVIDLNIGYILLFSLPISFLFTWLMSLFENNKINRVVAFIIWFIIFFVFAAETIYYSFYKTICGLSALSYGGQVMEFFSAIMVHVKEHILLLIGYLIPIIALIILSLRKNINHEKYNYRTFLLLFIPSLCLCISGLEINKENKDAVYNIFYNTNDLIESTNKMGLLSAIGLDSFKYLSGFEENISFVQKREFTKDIDTEYNITNIDFNTLIETETDNTIKSMHEYFSSQIPTIQNKYTGIYAGKNLIFITAEGFSPIAVDENITPTLYKMVNSSFVFNNYYQPIFNCSTSDGEFINSLSILPGVSTCSMKSTGDVYLPYALGNMFKDYGYQTYAFHGWDYSYYNRDITYPNMGYTYYGYDRYHRGYKYALKGIKDSWPTSDVDVINSSYPIYNQEEPFVAYYMSISGHLEYNFDGGNAMASRNKDAVKDMDASTAIKAYVATQVEFDKSLELLLNKLEEDGILDDTVIVISADHYPYGLSNDEIANYAAWMKNANFDLYKNNLIIYNPKQETVIVDKYTSSLDLLPTILNMFGVKYDSRLLIGNDIFSEAEDLVIFNNKSWITKKGRYNYLKKEFEPFEGYEYDQDYIDSINEIVKLKFQMSKLLISKDYYRKVLGD